jgi:hypothetical protein
MSGRWMTRLTGLLAAVAVVAWLRADAVTHSGNADPPELNRFYAVDLSGASRSFDVEFDGDDHYELIVASLGDAGRTFAVRLEAQTRQRVELFPALPVASLEPRNIAQAMPPRFARVEQVQGVAAAAERQFFLHVTADRLEDEQGYVPVTGRLAGEGDRVRVYLDRQTAPEEIAPGLIDEIIRLLDAEIIPRSREVVGEHADIDGDGKLTVLVTAWLGRLCGGKTSLNGCVRCNDFQADVEAPFGNHADVIYLNTSVAPGPALKALLAHEYTHAVCFSRRLAPGRRAVPLPVEEDWLNEAIAHVAENLHACGWSNLDRRIDDFLANTARSPLAVRDYYRSGLWRDAGCRGATYLFLRYCADQFGEGLLRDLVNGPAAGKRNLERATQTSFADLFRHWTIALSEGELPSVPLRGTVGECELTGPARVAWPVAAGPCDLELCGTASAFIELTATRSEVVRVVIDAEPQARLQVTLVRRATLPPGSNSRGP